MSISHTLYDNNNEQVFLTQNYIRYGNRILDASFIATVSVKKHKLLFNNFKQNTTLPVMAIPFKKETDARHALNLCVEFYALGSSNPFYGPDDKKDDVYLVDAYGGTMLVNPEFLKYRDRLISTADVRTAQVKGRRVLINRFKANMSVPTMCVHFADKNTAARALNTIESILWNVPVEKPDVEPLEEEEEENNSKITMSQALELLDKPADPAFFTFMVVSTSLLLALTFLRAILGPVDGGDEL